MTRGFLRVVRAIDARRLSLGAAVLLATMWVQVISGFDVLSGSSSAGSPAFMLAFAGVSCLLVAFPQAADRMFVRPPWAVVALGVSLATTLAGLSYGQALFSPEVFGWLSSALLGAACLVLIVAVMVPALHCFSRPGFLALVFVSYAAKRMLEGVVEGVSFDVVVAVVAFVVPFAVMGMASFGSRGTQVPAMPGGAGAAGHEPPVSWLALLVMALAGAIVLSGGTMDVSVSGPPGVVAIASDVVGSALLVLGCRLAFERSGIAETYRPVFVVATVEAVFLCASGAGALPWRACTIFAGVLLWLPAYDLARAGVSTALRVYGACNLGQIACGWIASGEAGHAALHGLCALVTLACVAAPLVEGRRARAVTPASVSATEGRGALSGMLARVCADVARESGLSEREAEVLLLLAQGLSRQAIGEQMGLSEATVKTYIHRIYAKLDVHSQTELARRIYG